MILPVPKNYQDWASWGRQMVLTLQKVVQYIGLGTVPTMPVTTCVFTGQVLLLAGTALPADFRVCSGGTVLIADYPELFAVLGVAYGGDGVTTFGIPNIVAAEPSASMQYVICTRGRNPLNN